MILNPLLVRIETKKTNYKLAQKRRKRDLTSNNNGYSTIVLPNGVSANRANFIC